MNFLKFFATSLKKFCAMVKAAGFIYAVKWAWFGAMRANRFEIFMVRRPGSGTMPQTEVKLTVATPAEIQALKDSGEFNSPEARVAEYMPAGRCFIFRADDEPVHVMWAFGEGDDSRFFNLGKGEAELNYSYTPLRHRGRGIFRKSLASAVAFLHGEGIETVYFATHSQNVGARTAIEREQFTRLGSLLHVGIIYRPKWKKT